MAKKTGKTAKAKKSATPKPRVAKQKTAPAMTDEMHSAAFEQLVADAHKFAKSPFCYKEYPDGSAQVCRLLPDGTYGDCKPYDVRPVPGPRCG